MKLTRIQPLITLSLISLLAACASNTPPAQPSPTHDAPVAAGFYRVQPGDTLYRIARRWGQSVQKLTQWNALTDPSQILVGQVLRVEPPNARKKSEPPRTVNNTAPTAISNEAPTLLWPLAHDFHKQYKKTNNGIDIPAPTGTAVLAAAAGRVVYAGSGIRHYGNMLIIKHNHKFLTVYAHNNALRVESGAQVEAGQEIAEVGSTGSAQRSQLHFELRQEGKPIRPEPYLPITQTSDG